MYYFVVLYPKMSVVRLLLIEKRKFVDSVGSTDFWAKGFLVETIRLRKIFSPDNWWTQSQVFVKSYLLWRSSFFSKVVRSQRFYKRWNLSSAYHVFYGKELGFCVQNLQIKSLHNYHKCTPLPVFSSHFGCIFM